MRSGRRLFLLCRAWLLLLPLLLEASLSGCGQCEAMTAPPVIPLLWAAGGQVYLYSYGAQTLYALRASDGKLLWQASGILEESSADQIYLEIDQNTSGGQVNSPLLEALQASTGKLLWHWHTEVDGTFQVVGTSAQSVLLAVAKTTTQPVLPAEAKTTIALVALDASTGSQRWKMPLAGLLPADYGVVGILSAQVQAGMVYLRSAAGVSAYNEESGALLWNDVFPRRIDTSLPWFISQGMIYLSADHVYALRASDGATLWQADPATIALDSDQGVLYTLSPQHFAALRIQDGQALWTQLLQNSHGNRLKLIDGMLYSGFSSPLAALPGVEVGGSDFSNGVSLNRASDGQALWSSPGDLLAIAGAGETVYLLSYQYAPEQPATLTALRAADGTQLWQQRLTGGAALIYADGALYTGYAGDNEVTGCIATGSATAAKLHSSDGTQVWHFQAA